MRPPNAKPLTVEQIKEMRLEKLRRDRADAEVILARWRTRFPNNQYAWPGAPEEFAIEALRAVRGDRSE